MDAASANNRFSLAPRRSGGGQQPPWRLHVIADVLRYAATLPDPVARAAQHDISDKACTIDHVRVSLGLIAMIYDARRNVTADAAPRLRDTKKPAHGGLQTIQNWRSGRDSNPRPPA